MFLLLSAVSVVFVSGDSPNSKEGFINSGTPGSVSKSFDCAVRQYAYEFGQSLQPRHGSFVDLFDSLQLEACNQIRPEPTARKIPYFSSKSMANSSCSFYISSIKGSNNNDGLSPNSPFQTIKKGITSARSARTGNEECRLYLMNGTFYQKETLLLNDKDSFLVIQNYNGENAIISGGIPIQFEGDWELVEYQPMEWKNYSGYSNIGNRATFNQSNDLVLFLGLKESYNHCFEAVLDNNNKMNAQTIYSFTWTSYFVFNDVWGGGCYGVIDKSWQPSPDGKGYYTSGRLEGMNVWRRKIKNFNEFGNNIPGLRVDGRRAIRARYPNQDPERAMQYDPLSGWLHRGGMQLAVWMDPIPTEPAKIVIKNATNYPEVEWPMDGPGGTTWTGEGAWGNYFQGIGGSCSTDVLGGVDPPFGYWCSIQAPRQIIEHKCPSGVYLLPYYMRNAPYNNVTGIVVHAWKPDHWYTWQWEGGEYDPVTGGLQFAKGGFQGGEGERTAWEWYFENVRQELDFESEYFYNTSTHILYYYHNVSSKTPPSDNMEFVSTYNNILINITGSQQAPVKNITIRGITFRDTRYTYLDPHGLPSGGDWALARQGNIFIEGTEYVIIDEIYMTRLDSTGIFLNGYNRYAMILNSEFEWLGENAIASWGYTTGLEEILPGYGPDGRNGDQPRHTIIKNNLVHEIGIFQKQSSMWFQAQTCQTYIENNIFFNGPRAAVNINDGFGGGNHMINNLLINTCRESGDHGPWNSWDRVPYITRVRNGTASIIPKYNQIHNNFIIGTYQTSVGIDTDDGSSYLNTSNNFFVYGDFGLKSDFSGHHHFHSDNIYAYTGTWFLLWDAGSYDRFYNNKFVSSNDNPDYCTYSSNCDLPPEANQMKQYIYNNSIYTMSGNCRVCGMPFNEWINKGNDIGSTIHSYPEDQQIIQWAKQLLS